MLQKQKLDITKGDNSSNNVNRMEGFRGGDCTRWFVILFVILDKDFYFWPKPWIFFTAELEFW